MALIDLGGNLHENLSHPDNHGYIQQNSSGARPSAWTVCMPPTPASRAQRYPKSEIRMSVLHGARLNIANPAQDFSTLLPLQSEDETRILYSAITGNKIH